MDVSYLLDHLNDKQRQAVSSEPNNQLILAGAGSGKTRVLVHRIAWLMQVEGLSHRNILAVTFTNKAARSARTGGIVTQYAAAQHVDGHLSRPC